MNHDDNIKLGSSTYPKEGHIIDNVPYVSQENSVFCAYACPTMIYKYFDLDINLADFLFNSGIGYSLTYSNPNFKYFLGGGIITSQWPLDREFVANLYGLKYESWFPTDLPSSIDEKWNQYWKILKEYIKNDIPVSASIDLTILSSTKKIIKSHLWIDTNKVPDFLWKLFSTAHEIVIVGFDEEKKLVYYNDPVTSVISNSKDGKYVSAPLEEFAKAVSNSKLGNFSPQFLINIYKKNGHSLSKESIFTMAHNRNIEKIKGNPLSYDFYWRNYPLGINALFSYKKDFEMILDRKNIDMISIYRVNTFKFNVMKKMFLLFGKESSLPIFEDTFNNFYKIISVEKEYVTEYLKNNTYGINGLESEIEYFKDEIYEWNKLSNLFPKFYREVLLLEKRRNEIISKNYISTISKIIDNQKKIINYS